MLIRPDQRDIFRTSDFLLDKASVAGAEAIRLAEEQEVRGDQTGREASS